LGDDERQLLRKFLGRLRGTADYTNASVRPHLVARVCELLTALDSDAALRAQVLDCISQGLSSCDDRVILIMNQVELAVRIHEAERGGLDDRALKTLVLGLMQLDIVHTHARAKVRSQHFADEVEVFLAYEIGLRDTLQLPVSTQTMLFARCSMVSPEDLQAAQIAAQEAVADMERVAAYFASSAPWKQHLRRLSVTAWSWDNLEPRPMPSRLRLHSLQCPLTLASYAELTQPLVWQQGEVCVVYEAADFVQHWLARGFEPTTRRVISLDELVRPAR
jgi:hypothetical protein